MNNKHLSIRIDEPRHKFLAEQAASLGITINEYIKRLIDRERANTGIVDRIRSGK